MKIKIEEVHTVIKDSIEFKYFINNSEVNMIKENEQHLLIQTLIGERWVLKNTKPVNLKRNESLA